MRILLVSDIEVVDGKTSLTIQPMAFIRQALRDDPHARFGLAVPAQQRRKTGPYGLLDPRWMRLYLPEGEQLEQRVELVPSRIHLVGSRRQSCVAGGKTQHAFVEDSLYDAIVSVAFASNPAIWQTQQLVEGDRVCRRPLVGWSLWTSTEGWTEIAATDKITYIEPVGALACDLTAFESAKVARDHYRMWSGWMNDKALAEAKQKTAVVPNGANLENVPCRIWDGTSPLTGLWSGYVREDWREAWDALMDAYWLGAIDRVVFQEINANFPDVVRKTAENDPNIELHGPKAHDEYLEFLQQGDLFPSLTNGLERTYGIRFAEMIASGMLPVVHEEVATTFLYDDYPYQATSAGVLRKAFVQAAKDLRRQGPSLAEKPVAYVREHHDSAKTMTDLYRMTRELAVEHRRQTDYGPWRDVVRHALDDRDEVDHDEAVQQIQKVAPDLTDEPLPPENFLRWAMLEEGWTDTGECPVRYLKE